MVGAWRPRAVSRQGTLEGRERAVVPLIEAPAAHTQACRDLGPRFPTAEGQDGVQTVCPPGLWGMRGRCHRCLLLFARSRCYTHFVEDVECEMPAGLQGPTAGFFRPSLQENTAKCVLHLRRRNQIGSIRSSWTP